MAGGERGAGTAGHGAQSTGGQREAVPGVRQAVVEGISAGARRASGETGQDVCSGQWQSMSVHVGHVSLCKSVARFGIPLLKYQDEEHLCIFMAEYNYFKMLLLLSFLLYRIQ